MYTRNDLYNILINWDLKLHACHPEISVSGSPERTEYRIVVETNEGRFYIVEQLAPDRCERKRLINNILCFLHNQGMNIVNSYIKTPDGNSICEYRNQFWQIQPFMPGIPLDRPAYLNDPWRGVAMADFLIDLKKNSAGIADIISKSPFSIKDYVIDFMQKVHIHNPELLQNLEEIFHCLENSFFKQHDELEIIFCHGDYHPLNILWSENEILAVIDWEFAGFKPVLYDVANMIGCLGMEQPRSMLGPITTRFLNQLFTNHFITIDLLECLPEFILSLRFAWLAEWLRKQDKEMIKLELTFMYLLLDNREKLLTKWQQG